MSSTLDPREIALKVLKRDKTSRRHEMIMMMISSLGKPRILHRTKLCNLANSRAIFYMRS